MGGGWFRDEDDDAHLRRKGMKSVIDLKEAKGHSCDRCGSNFDSLKGLTTHQTRKGTCRTKEEMSSKDLRKLRRTRQTSASRRGKTPVQVEEVRVKTCEGKLTKPCGSFVYLGTLTTPNASATPEVRRRTGTVLGVFGSLSKVWKSKKISKKTKARLYSAIILSLMLYNAEVWTIKQQDIKALEGAHFRMLRSMMSLEDHSHISKKALLKHFDIPLIEDLVSQKRIRWVGHALRRHEKDRSRIAVTNCLDDASSSWTDL